MVGTGNTTDEWLEDVQSPGALISYIYRTDQIFLAREMKPYQIGSGQFPFLMTLYHEGGGSQDELTQAKGYDKATTTRALKKLEDAGYITRQKDQRDGRARMVHLTDKGEKIRPGMEGISGELSDILFDGFTDDEQRNAHNLLRKMALNLSAYMRQYENK